MTNKLKLTIFLLVIGFLIAIQYNTVQKPTERDTRDTWAIRNELSNEKKLHSDLLNEIRRLDKTLHQYETLTNESAEEALRETVDTLRHEMGITDIEGPGLIIEVEPSPESIAFGKEINQISPDLLTRFINELNRVKWTAMEIDGHRYTALSSIRDINGDTTINGLPLNSPPFTIKIVTESEEDRDQIYNRLYASLIHDDFYLDDLLLSVRMPQDHVHIKGWKENIKQFYLQELSKGE